ncbi:MAG: amidohydrolase family protein [Gemmatimonadota bacterium]
MQASRAATLNGATYLGKASMIGSIEVGKQADLLVVTGNPAERISEVRRQRLPVNCLPMLDI